MRRQPGSAPSAAVIGIMGCAPRPHTPAPLHPHTRAAPPVTIKRQVHQAKREVSYDSALKWIKRHDMQQIDK